MSKVLRVMTLAATAAALVLAATPAMAVGPNQNATGTARIFRPLQLQFVQNLDLGKIILSGTPPFTATVQLSSANVLTCPAAVTCSGATTVAQYRVIGTNNQNVTVSAPNVTLSDGSGNNLTLTTAGFYSPTVALGASGNAGVVFSIGGSITVANTTPDGVYTGTFNVTADYQ